MLLGRCRRRDAGAMVRGCRRLLGPVLRDLKRSGFAPRGGGTSDPGWELVLSILPGCHSTDRQRLPHRRGTIRAAIGLRLRETRSIWAGIPLSVKAAAPAATPKNQMQYRAAA